jgi:hypothetical protein
MVLNKQSGFVLPGVLGVCALLISISGGLLMQTTEARLAMRKAAKMNSFSMSMDTVMRDFGRKTAEIAVAGEGAMSLIDPSNFAGSLRESFPAEWLHAADVVSPPMANIGVSVEGFPDARLDLPDLMGTPTSYSVLTARADRANLIRSGQNFAGREWGLKVTSNVEVFDNLAELEGSWYRRNLATDSKDYSKRVLGQADPDAQRPVLLKRRSENVVKITEIPSQFSVQGQNMALEPSAVTQVNRIGKAGSESPVVLGKNIDIAPGVDMKSDRRVVARGRIFNRGLLDSGTSQVQRAIAGGATVQGRGYEQELEEAGSILLVNVGTRGPEIFRPSRDYSASLVSTGQEMRKAAALDGSMEHLRYWLPYYQCNIRVIVRMPSSSPLTNQAIAEQYSVSAVYSTYNKPPIERSNLDPLPAAFSGLNTTDTINRFGKAVLNTSGPAAPRPVVVVSRHSYNSRTGESQWVNTVDVDVRKIQELAKQADLPHGAAVALHIDIRDANGNYLPNAENFPVVLRQGKQIMAPISVVTPGTIYLQGPFAAEAYAGATYPFSLLAPKVRFGMVSRDPADVLIQGQKITVGQSNPNTPSAPLEVRTGSGSTEVNSGNLLANAHQGSGGLRVPPVHLKDWLIETFNIWVDL